MRGLYFFITLVVSTFLCKDSLDSTQPQTHTHTQVGSGGRTAHADLILSDKTLWGVQRERGRWWEREREEERETCWKRGEGDASGASSANYSYKVKAGAFGMPPHHHQSLPCTRVDARPIKMWIKYKVHDRGVCHDYSERRRKVGCLAFSYSACPRFDGLKLKQKIDSYDI